jgi:hypothetical protein
MRVARGITRKERINNRTSCFQLWCVTIPQQTARTHVHAWQGHLTLTNSLAGLAWACHALALRARCLLREGVRLLIFQHIRLTHTLLHPSHACCRNGDSFFHGRSMAINPKKIANLDIFFDQVSSKLNNGPVCPPPSPRISPRTSSSPISPPVLGCTLLGVHGSSYVPVSRSGVCCWLCDTSVGTDIYL